jgi:predicted SAM-dependent methyltransferase
MRDCLDALRLHAGRIALRTLTRLMPQAIRPTLRRARAEMAAALRHDDATRRARSLHWDTPLRMNLGCGPNPRAGWLNVDLVPGADLTLDIRRPLPFPDASCAEIYAEHVLEHLAYPGEVEQVLADWFRVLARGGTVSLGVPDTESALRAYVSGDDGYFAWCRTQPWHRDWVRTRLDTINYLFRQQSPTFGEAHLYAYDFETLAERLVAAGFVDVTQRPFDPTFDSEDRRIGTLYVRATKA